MYYNTIKIKIKITMTNISFSFGCAPANVRGREGFADVYPKNTAEDIVILGNGDVIYQKKSLPTNSVKEVTIGDYTKKSTNNAGNIMIDEINSVGDYTKKSTNSVGNLYVMNDNTLSDNPKFSDNIKVSSTVVNKSKKSIENTRFSNMKLDKSLTLKTGEMASIGPVCKMGSNGQTYPKMNEFAYVQGPGTLRYPGAVIPDMSGEECSLKTYKGKETITLVNGLLKQLVSNN